jgi:hypothetical protein
MRMKIGMLGFAFAAVFVAACYGGQDLRVEEGKPLYPPNFIGSGDADLLGYNIPSLTSLPFTGVIEAENSKTEADGKTTVRRFRTRVARDSYGRLRTDIDMNPEGSAVNPQLLQISIYDPVSKTTKLIFPAAKVAIRQSTLPAPPSHNRSKAPVIMTDSLPASIPADLPLLNIDIHREDLGRETVDGVSLLYGRQTIRYPAGFGGNKDASSRVIDYWYSIELQAFVRVRQVGPGKSVHTLTLENISHQQPARALFQIPAGYHVDEPKAEEVPGGYGYCPVP